MSHFAHYPKPKKKMLILYLALLVFAIIVMLGIRRCPTDSIMVPAEKQGGTPGDTIDIAIIYAPGNYYMYADTLGGYSYDLLRLMARKENLQLRFWPVTSLSDALSRLDKGDYDLLASLPQTGDYKDRVLFTDSIFTDRQVLVAKMVADTIPPITSVLQLAGQTVDIEADSPALNRLSNLQKEIGDSITVRPHDDLSGELLVMKVAQGDFQYAVVNEIVATSMQERFEGLAIIPLGFTQLQAWAVAKGNKELQERLNRIIRAEASTAPVKALRKRYFRQN